MARVHPLTPDKKLRARVELTCDAGAGFRLRVMLRRTTVALAEVVSRGAGGSPTPQHKRGCGGPGKARFYEYPHK